MSLDQYKFCDICVNKGFSLKDGIICELTNAKPDFVGTCDKFEEHKAKPKKPKKSWSEVSSYKKSNDSLYIRIEELENRVSVLWTAFIIGIVLGVISLIISLLLLSQI